MKKAVLIMALITMTLPSAGTDGWAQTANPPRARGDQNGDGICDVTGQPVGQGRNGGGPGLNPNCPYNRPSGTGTALQSTNRRQQGQPGNCGQGRCGRGRCRR